MTIVEFKEQVENIKNLNNEVKSPQNVLKLYELQQKVIKIIDNLFLGHDSLTKFINDKFNYNLNIEFMSDCFLIEDELAIESLTLTRKALEKVLFRFNDQFNFDMFIEIKYMLLYYETLNHKLDVFKNFKALYSLGTPKYHEQNSMFKYLFSCFDKFSYIARFIAKKYDDNWKQTYDDIRFSSTFTKDLAFIFKTPSDLEEFKELIKKMSSSNAWHFIRKLRNALEHEVLNPKKEYNMNYALNLLFIMLCRVMLQLILNLLPRKSILYVLKNSKKAQEE